MYVRIYHVRVLGFRPNSVSMLAAPRPTEQSVSPKSTSCRGGWKGQIDHRRPVQALQSGSRNEPARSFAIHTHPYIKANELTQAVFVHKRDHAHCKPVQLEKGSRVVEYP